MNEIEQLEKERWQLEQQLDDLKTAADNAQRTIGTLEAESKKTLAGAGLDALLDESLSIAQADVELVAQRRVHAELLRRAGDCQAKIELVERAIKAEQVDELKSQIDEASEVILEGMKSLIPSMEKVDRLVGQCRELGRTPNVWLNNALRTDRIKHGIEWSERERK